MLEHGAAPTREMKADPDTENYGRMPMIEDIHYADVRPGGVEWQWRCQHWLRDHGISRTDEMGAWKQLRENLGDPSEPKEIPLLWADKKCWYRDPPTAAFIELFVVDV